MKKIYERPALIKKGNLKLITAATNGPIVTSGPTPQ
ncbi:MULTISPECIES: putative RiPP precursor [unclassified Mesorhizobium]|nr:MULTISPECIES: putative RiPP precursor [unclassified Mesorhizobium]